MMAEPLPEHLPASKSDPLDAIAQANDLAILDEELNRLPQKYGDVLVMSYMAQQTNQEIADQLNESKGAIDGRIREARRILRVRLARRGVRASVLTWAVASVQSSALSASCLLIQKTIRLGAPGMAGEDFQALNAAEVARMRSLTSTGMPLMTKIGPGIATGLLLVTGVWGMAQLLAFQHSGVVGIATDDDETQTIPDLKPQLEVTTFVDPPDGREATVTTASNRALSNSSRAGSLLSDGPERGSSESLSAGRALLSGAAAEFSRRTSREAEQKLNEMMQAVHQLDLDFPGEASLATVLSEFQEQLQNSRGLPVVISLDFRVLRQESFTSLNDVNVYEISIPGGLMTTGSLLDHILSQTDEPQLTWIAKDELLLITTVPEAEREKNMFLRSYDIAEIRQISQLMVRDLSSSGRTVAGSTAVTALPYPSGDTGTGESPFPAVVKESQTAEPGRNISRKALPSGETANTWDNALIDTIQLMTQPVCHWYNLDGEGGRLFVAGNRLVVRQSRKGHEQVVLVLEQLKMASDVTFEASR